MSRVRFGFLLLAVFCSSLIYAGGTITRFALEPGYNKVTVRWEVQNESDVKGYEVQRGLSERDFSKIGYMDAKKPRQALQKYEYVDKSVFKYANSGSRTFYYRIKVLKLDGSFQYSKVQSVTPTVSSARQTWGMIKAMFR